MVTVNFLISDSETEGSYDYDSALEKTGKISTCLLTNIVIRPYNYSGGSNSERSKTESIRKLNVLKFGFRMVYSNRMDHLKTEHSI